jgi:HD-GYP domain-containing protein (c-di-GMP phosphodiesterase class II)
LPDQGKLFTLSNAGDVPEWAYSAVLAILSSLQTVDPATYEHCLRVGKYSQKLAKAAGLNDYQQKIAEFSGLLHDVGKMGIDRSIIHKPGRLTEEEYEKVMNHPVLSEKIVAPLGHHEFFKQILPAVRGHHERIDGDGYPDRLEGDDIPLISRVILIVDTLDAMGQDRSYRKGLSVDAIYKELQRFSDVQFDKTLVKIFLESHRFWVADPGDAETAAKISKKVA